MKASPTSRLDKTSRGICFAIVLMAILVLIGWHSHARMAVQILPGLIPMQYNTALCFLALALASLSLGRKNKLPIVIGGTFVALMGAVVVLEYAMKVSIGIDTLFFVPWERALSAHPGRMALTTAISFLLNGTALVVLAGRRRAYTLSAVIGSVPLSLALTSLTGYAFHVTYVLPFSLGSQMALHTASAFLAYGIVMLSYSWRHAERNHDGLPTWGSGSIVVLILVLFMAISVVNPPQSWLAVLLQLFVAIIAGALFGLEEFPKVGRVKAVESRDCSSQIPVWPMFAIVG